MNDSILTSIKKLLGITEEYMNFDTDIIIHINSALMVLNQLGVGPSDGFSIQDKTSEWSEFITDEDKLDAVKTYVYLKVKLVFDPPLNGSVMEALKQSITEYEWRLNVQADSN